MQTVAERIMQLVDVLEDGNKSAFARKSKVTPAYISKLGKNLDSAPTDRVIDDICSAYGINKKWLVDGVGQMRTPRTLAEEAGQIAREAATVNKDEAEKFFYNLVDGMTEAEIVTMYTVFKRWQERRKEEGHTE